MTRHKNRWREMRNGNYVCRRFLIVVLSSGKSVLFEQRGGEPKPPFLMEGSLLDCMREGNRR